MPELHSFAAAHSTNLNARIPVNRESREAALEYFLARINANIAGLENLPATRHFLNIIDYLKCYRDGDPNFPMFTRTYRSPTQKESAFTLSPAFGSSHADSPPLMGGEF